VDNTPYCVEAGTKRADVHGSVFQHPAFEGEHGERLATFEDGGADFGVGALGALARLDDVGGFVPVEA